MRTIERKYIEKVNTAFGFEAAKKLTEFKTIPEGFRTAGTKAERDAADWIARTMSEIGLTNVNIESLPADVWEFHGADLTFRSEEGQPATVSAGSFPGLKGTGPEGIAGEIVYVGDGTASCYEGIDVRGKLVFIDTNAYNSHWYSVLFAQAQQRGAAAVIASVTDQGPGTYCDGLITIQNIQGFVDIPAIMLTRESSVMLRHMLQGGAALTGVLRTDIRTQLDGEAHYVYGEIQGKTRDSLIIYSGHYDAYWDGFLDNASSIGSMLTIAKAMVESGYQPDATIVFLANGAEECGKFGTAHDYCVGSTAILKDYPEWVENTKLCVNFELTAYNEVGCFMATASGGFADWIKTILQDSLPEEECRVIPMSISGADHTVFHKAGIPTCMNIATCFGGKDELTASAFDHTQYDNEDRYDAKAFDLVNKAFGVLGIQVDNSPLIKLDYDNYLKGFADLQKLAEAEDDNMAEAGTGLAAEVSRFQSAAQKLTQCCQTDVFDKEKASSINNKLLRINRIFAHDVYKYSAMLELIVGHKQPLDYVEAIDGLIKGLQTGRTDALAALEELDYNYLIRDFDKEVYEKTALQAFDDSYPQQWVEGNTLPFPDLYDVISAIFSKACCGAENYAEEIEQLSDIRQQQYEVLHETLKNESVLIAKATELAEELCREIADNR